MIACAMLKGVRLGALEESYRTQGKKTFDGIRNHFLKIRDGMIELENICLVAGLGPDNKTRRDGSFLYMTQEGTETLSFFSGSLSDEIKEQVIFMPAQFYFNKTRLFLWFFFGIFIE